MKPLILTAAALALLASHAAAEPVRLIYDTDMGNDVDDALALGLIHSLQLRGECRLLAVTLTKDHPLAAAYTDAVNAFYGRGNVPIGVVRNGATREQGRFIGLAEARDGDALRYPHSLRSGEDAPEATALLRRILAAQPDRSVVFVQVGFSTNLARLLDSPADDVSPLTGRELVAAKARLLSIMAGAFQPIRRQRHREYNVVQDIPSAKKIAADWPTPVIWSGYEIGIAIPYPAVSIERDYRYVAHHPVVEAYVLYNPPPHNRPTWDLTSVLYAVRPDRGYFGLSEPGRVIVEDDGGTRFEPDPNGPHRYLTADAQQCLRVTELFVALCSQPPCLGPLDGDESENE
ncbi:MAG: nucleoside hydrolase [Thermoguttaceae bacterium]|jgi:inosine-uridine nucleoside N-ribohydrolase|nr:nucleoside hydrolase [Thermoguttaceae bacterium]